MFRILQYYNNYNACHIHRLLLPARYCGDILREEGVEFVASTNRLPSKGEEDELSCFCWHGVPHPQLLAKASYWQSNGIKLLWSVDDDYRELPPWNPIKFSDDQKGGFHWASHQADHILSSTEYLSNTFKKETMTTPNLLECGQYFRYDKPRGAKLRVVWAGSTTHIGDLSVLVEPVTKLITKYGDRAEFIFFGECHPELRRRHLGNGLQEVEGVPMGDYLMTLRHMSPDIWLCPIADHEFNLSKSNLKVLEGWGLISGVIASNRGPYKCIKHGETGLLCETEDHWYEAIASLIEDPRKTQVMASNGFEEVQSNWNWENRKCVEPWLEMFRKVAMIKGSS